MFQSRTIGLPAGTTILVALLLVLAPAMAEAAGMKTARFKMTVSGTQTTDWTLDSTTYDGCIDGDVRRTGSGRERFSFRSRRPGTLDVIEVDREVVVSAGAGGLPVRGTVSQQGAIRTEQLSGGESGCGGTEDPRPDPAPDCGTRSWRGTVQPMVYALGDYPATDAIVPLVPVLALTGPDLSGGDGLGSLFENCPGAEGQLIATPNSGFLVRRIFSKARRVVIRGEDSVTEGEDGYTKKVTVKWKAVLVRRGGRSPARLRAPQCANGRDDDSDGRIDHPRDPGCSGPQDRSER